MTKKPDTVYGQKCVVKKDGIDTKNIIKYEQAVHGPILVKSHFVVLK